MPTQLKNNYKEFYSNLTLDQLTTTIEALQNELDAEKIFGKLANSKVSEKLQIKLDLANSILNSK